MWTWKAEQTRVVIFRWPQLLHSTPLTGCLWWGHVGHSRLSCFSFAACTQPALTRITPTASAVFLPSILEASTSGASVTHPASSPLDDFVLCGDIVVVHRQPSSVAVSHSFSDVSHLHISRRTSSFLARNRAILLSHFGAVRLLYGRG
jgi:hypothetical protein